MTDITTLIAIELATIFPDEPITRENTEQGFSPNSFYIHEVRTKPTDQFMGHELWEHRYSIVYFPDEDNDNVGVKEQCAKVRWKLLNEFKVIDGLKARALDREFAIEDDTLVFKFKLQYRVKPGTDDFVAMQNITAKGGLFDDY